MNNHLELKAYYARSQREMWFMVMIFLIVMAFGAAYCLWMSESLFLFVAPTCILTTLLMIGWSWGIRYTYRKFGWILENVKPIKAEIRLIEINSGERDFCYEVKIINNGAVEISPEKDKIFMCPPIWDIDSLKTEILSAELYIEPTSLRCYLICTGKGLLIKH